MPRRPDPADLLFAREVAELLGYSHVNNVYRLEGLKPFKDGPGCKVWWRPDVERFKRERDRRR